MRRRPRSYATEKRVAGKISKSAEVGKVTKRAEPASEPPEKAFIVNLFPFLQKIYKAFIFRLQNRKRLPILLGLIGSGFL
jgi:hypothetical protein